MAKVLKALCVLFIFSAVIISGCTAASEHTSLVTDFTADFTADYRGMNLSGNITAARQGITDISIISPNELKGLNARYRDSVIELKRDSLSCTADEAFLPSQSFPAVVKNILDCVNRGDVKPEETAGGELVYPFDSNCGKCTVTAQKNGLIKSAEITEIGFDIKFQNVSAAS